MEERKPSKERAQPVEGLFHRKTEGGFVYPFGVYPESHFSQKEGYDSRYLRDETCFHYQITVSHERIMDLFTTLSRLLPKDIYLVARVHSGDYYRESDTYLSETTSPREKVLSWIYEWKDVVTDDGFLGIGLFSEGQASEVFLDEHKTINVYHQDPEKVEKALEKLAIPFMFIHEVFWDKPHYHEPLPIEGESGVDYLTAFEDMADTYDLYLDEDEGDDPDSASSPLIMECWSVELRGCSPVTYTNKVAKGFYSSLFVNAHSRREAIEIVEEYLERRDERADLFLQMARTPISSIPVDIGRKNPGMNNSCVWYESERVTFDWSEEKS